MRGFTVVELAITMSVAAILTVIAVPAMQSIIANERRVGEVNEMVGSLNYARSESVKQNAAAGVSVTAVGTWGAGWNTCCSAAGVVLQTVPAISSKSTVKAQVGGTGVTQVSFDGNGALLGAGGTVVFTFCDPRGASLATALEVNMLGQIATGAKAGYRVDQTTALVCP